MKVTLDREDLLTLVYGTGGPGKYTHPFEKYGKLTGFPNEHWEWNKAFITLLYDHQLWDLYQELKKFKNT